MQYKLIKKVQDEIFDPSQLDKYVLLMSIGTRDVQICVVLMKDKKCLLVEDYAMENVRTVNDRIRLLQQLFSNHLFVRGGFWKEIRCSIKGHKFALIPRTLYSKESASHFFSLNSNLNSSTERLYAYLHKSLGTVNVFAADYKLIDWLRKLYPSKQITLVSQGSVLIESGLQLYGQKKGKAMLFLIDKKVLHILVMEQSKLLYYNQFAVQDVNELVKYVLLVFKELGLAKQQAPLLFYGNVPGNSTYVVELRNRIQQLKLGKRPTFLRYPYPFDDIASHHYLDLFNIYLCQGFYPI